MTREKILEAAAQMFSQKGFHATSMQDIARAVNLQKASLYHHVASKQEILLVLANMAMITYVLRWWKIASAFVRPARISRSFYRLKCSEPGLFLMGCLLVGKLSGIV